MQYSPPSQFAYLYLKSDDHNFCHHWLLNSIFFKFTYLPVFLEKKNNKQSCPPNLHTSLPYGLKKKNLAYGETLSHVTINIQVALKSLAPEQFLITSETLSSCCEMQQQNNCFWRFLGFLSSDFIKRVLYPIMPQWMDTSCVHSSLKDYFLDGTDFVHHFLCPGYYFSLLSLLLYDAVFADVA